MIVAIVGTTTDLTVDQEQEMRHQIYMTLMDYPPETIIISGGAKGVDTLTTGIAKTLGFKTKSYLPIKPDWEHYKKRNLEIANDCDTLHCFSIPTLNKKCYHHNPPQDHEKTAGCWTMNKAIELGKNCRLTIIS